MAGFKTFGGAIFRPSRYRTEEEKKKRQVTISREEKKKKKKKERKRSKISRNSRKRR
jgi:hypothetical protein